MSNTTCDLDTPVPDWVSEPPVTLAVFQEYGIDYCCGGKSLAYACSPQGIDAKMALAKPPRCLEANRQGNSQSQSPDCEVTCK